MSHTNEAHSLMFVHQELDDDDDEEKEEEEEDTPFQGPQAVCAAASASNFGEMLKHNADDAESTIPFDDAPGPSSSNGRGAYRMDIGRVGDSVGGADMIVPASTGGEPSSASGPDIAAISPPAQIKTDVAVTGREARAPGRSPATSSPIRHSRQQLQGHQRPPSRPTVGRDVEEGSASPSASPSFVSTAANGEAWTLFEKAHEADHGTLFKGTAGERDAAFKVVIIRRETNGALKNRCADDVASLAAEVKFRR
ncbi:unnamed protein product [Vitrella brassicaformis CCMP3155]|uniref:Uncharacterized protein n=1 Tax=Vitrella brassicaformis (strain CCMP3155) TaxID=1169540 RepID=A0A0G4F0L9_VITBC|nr:unnamed protein product [Vitrella brassicaformis CCMP3155]|eukprot:CEM05391.1 unnamed protein product [Vitrella brassicaformis CCMP3155]